MQLKVTCLSLTPGVGVRRAACCADKESEAPGIPDLRTQAEPTRVQASLGLQHPLPSHGIPAAVP